MNESSDSSSNRDSPDHCPHVGPRPLLRGKFQLSYCCERFHNTTASFDHIERIRLEVVNDDEEQEENIIPCDFTLPYLSVIEKEDDDEDNEKGFKVIEIPADNEEYKASERGRQPPHLPMATKVTKKKKGIKKNKKQMTSPK